MPSKKGMEQATTWLKSKMAERDTLDAINAEVCYNVIADLDNQKKKIGALYFREKNKMPKTGHWIYEDKRYEAWSHTCSECGKRMTTAAGIYANFCWNCGAMMVEDSKDEVKIDD